LFPPPGGLSRPGALPGLDPESRGGWGPPPAPGGGRRASW